MALFVIQWRDKPGHLQTRLDAREAHLAYVASTPGVVKLGGPFLDEEGQMAGSMLIVEAQDLDAAKAWHAADPYKAAGLFETSTVTPTGIMPMTLAAPRRRSMRKACSAVAFSPTASKLW